MNISVNPLSECFWQLDLTFDSEEQSAGRDVEDVIEDNMIAEKSSFQRFIVFLDPEPSQWDIVKVPEQFVSENWHHIPFKVKVLLPNGLCNQGSEVEYSIPVKDGSDIVSFQDKILGNGWNFISIANESLLYDGEIEIPTPYFKQFQKVIPPYVLYGLKNGELFKGRLERIEEISVKTEPIDDTAVEDVTGIAVYDDPSDHQVDVIPKEFTVIMTKSNVDNTSHGVYIPNNITPENRQWTSNEDGMSLSN
ncbi:hypothetical protein POM88_028710 [Heracleum sosnowskyi]|uniref:Uncharacterized protein n=1 Tax=Heracleum sosnowskyi TaxID=360622 RepID=A0AAD8HSE8_9APIA|nr:hypothetical protein POM88_028710 [Heracleum sosnowskyi]